MEPVTALILAGGRATRMGGRDKGLLTLNGRNFVNLLAEQLSPQVDAIRINANRNLADYEATGYPVIRDELEDYQGPLAGMLAGLRTIGEGWLLTVPCDGPFVARDYAKRMVSAAGDAGHKLAVASDGGRLQPVYALIHLSLADSLENFLSSGDRKIDRWYAEHDFSTVSFADAAEMFTNVNTPDDLAELEESPGP